MSVNSLFDIGSTSLRAVGEKIDATSQNIANAESEGYRRRRVSLSSRSVAATGLYASNGAQDVTSSGVGVEQFERVRDGMLVGARNEARSSESAAREEGRVLGVLEGALATDTDASLSASLQGLADGFSNLANNPESQGVRESVLGRARQLTDTFGRLDQRLGELTSSTTKALASNVEKANGLLDKVASLNEQIESARAGGSPDYAAEDQRDQTVKELSKLLPVEAQENRSDGYTLTVDGMTVVQGDDATTLSTENKNDPSKPTRVEFGDTGVAFDPGEEGGGEIGAQARLLNDTLTGKQSVQDRLDTLADSVVEKVNTAHRRGPTRTATRGRTSSSTSPGRRATSNSTSTAPRTLRPWRRRPSAPRRETKRPSPSARATLATAAGRATSRTDSPSAPTAAPVRSRCRRSPPTETSLGGWRGARSILP